MIIQDTMYKSVQIIFSFLRPIPVIRSIPESECTHELNYAYTYLALCAFIFLVLNIPVPTGRLTPAVSSIFNIVSCVTLLSPWGAGFPCVRREGVSVHHTTSYCFFVCFFCFRFS